ncbi:DsbA family protein [Aggregatilineales bacterium SYSU G02658]
MEAPKNTPSSALNYAFVAIIFLAVGIIIGLNVDASSISRADVDEVVRAALADTRVQIDDTALQAAISSLNLAAASGSGGSVDAAALSQAVTEALAQQARDEAQRERLKMVDDDPFRGPEDAPIIMVEFSAYACPFCGRHFQQTLGPLLENYGQYIRYVYRDFPVIRQEVSFPAAMAAQCAFEQDKFWEFHDLLFQNQSELGRDLFMRIGREVGLEMEAFTACVDENRYENEVLDDYYAGDALGITGTPSFYINGQIVSGALPYERFERIILAELNRLGITPEN